METRPVQPPVGNAMKLWALLSAVVFGAGFAAFAFYFMQRGPNRRHEPVEYYRGFAGYSHPVTLTIPISQDEADALAAKGAAYLVGSFDSDGKLMHVVKYLNREVFFDFVYSYYPNGKIKSAVVKGDGRATVFQYDTRGRQDPSTPGFW
jgi:hypothetical protein